MKVKALKPWSNGEISMEQYEVRDLTDALAQDLIDAGIVVEIGGGSGGGGVLVVHVGEGDALDKTWNEIDAADVAVIVFSGSEGGETWHIRELVVNTSVYNGDYFVNGAGGGGGDSTYMVSDPDDYPVRQH